MKMLTFRSPCSIRQTDGPFVFCSQPSTVKRWNKSVDTDRIVCNWPAFWPPFHLLVENPCPPIRLGSAGRRSERGGRGGFTEDRRNRNGAARLQFIGPNGDLCCYLDNHKKPTDGPVGCQSENVHRAPVVWIRVLATTPVALI